MENILRGSVTLAAVALSGLVAAACGGAEDGRGQATRTTAPVVPAAQSPLRTIARSTAVPVHQVRPQGKCRAGELHVVGSDRFAFAAVVRGRTAAFRAPGKGALASFERLNVNRVPTVFGVLAAVVDGRCRAIWYRVRLPMRPNGTVGYVRARDVRVARIRTQIRVDLSRRRVTLFRNGREVFYTTAAIGTPATPTPIGRYYVNQRLIPSNPYGPFGPGAIGISAFSDVLTGWTQGGPIAIHGTNHPELLGQRVSNGCIRINNRDLRRLWAATLAGTPVTIHP